ncbi:prepilin-type N-terminal cleavage/methylation domain-containing protein [Halobacillus yeomjeoni]|uniref:ComG operon protein 3 n=1 Tax=Halobacillus yeomjeoni TaxID=311194 RepID=A0A931MUD2_9BACI|nr:competence type IV pilus major pilin ComGC [Halobacillus yeomjeoni]MBH0229858.1 prepilin-type N-terminal cleavage/methylation domain-containing protein [Halobacillus yeomjeoni]MCA0982764.1 prepilin-type N-terminal cleavage/methylation domain-containing protein [Halobacillus yeomjeoni]
MTNQKGFTLIEMLIVLLVISVLLIITIPNLTQHNESVREKGCEALTVTTQAQVESYYLENNSFPTVTELLNGGYIKTSTCPNGDTINVDTQTGVVSSQTPPAP